MVYLEDLGFIRVTDIHKVYPDLNTIEFQDRSAAGDFYIIFNLDNKTVETAAYNCNNEQYDYWLQSRFYSVKVQRALKNFKGLYGFPFTKEVIPCQS